MWCSQTGKGWQPCWLFVFIGAGVTVALLRRLVIVHAISSSRMCCVHRTTPSFRAANAAVIATSCRPHSACRPPCQHHQQRRSVSCSVPAFCRIVSARCNCQVGRADVHCMHACKGGCRACGCDCCFVARSLFWLAGLLACSFYFV